MEAYLGAILVVALIYALLSLGLALQYGLTGLINFGHVGFFALGAYASALLSLAGVPAIVSYPAGAALAALAAWPIGLVSLRLKDDYFAIVTLGFSETVRLVLTSERWLTNGVQGLPGIPRLFADLSGGAGPLALLAVLGASVAGGAWIIRRIARSPYGRVLGGIRDNEEAVRALGKDPAAFKVGVLMVGSALAGLAGAFYAGYITYIVPEQFIPLVTFYVWMAILLGGVGRVSGALAGTAILMLFLEGSRFLRDALPGVSEVEMASLRLGAVGLLLVVFTVYRPDGLMGGRTAR